MSLSSLKPLAGNRDALLLAEIAALLHDVGKLTDAHVEHVSGSNQWTNDDGYKAVVDNPAAIIRLSPAAANIKKPDILNNVLNAASPKAADFLPPKLKTSLETLRTSLLSQDYSLAELIMLGMPGFATHQKRAQFLDGKDGWLPALLGLCHNVAHVDKEDPIGGEQSLPDVLTSNAFGYERQVFILDDPQKNLNSRISTLAIDSSDLATTCRKILETLEYGLGDTRRPINEVTLADWSAIVAALFKTAIAGALLTGTKPGIRQWQSWRDKIIDHDFHWRLLRVNFDVLGLYAKAIKIGDLLGYQRAVDQACAAIKKLVEEEYPLGNEIYRDTTGIYFTFPDLDLPADLAQEILRRVETVEPELAPRIAVIVGDGATATEQLKGILAKARREALQALAQPFDSQNLSDYWQKQWTTVGQGNWELCPVCRLRPMEEGHEACEHCENRRGSRVADWQKDPHRTIWMDELADANGRVALIVGRFGLEDWLSGDLVQTMLVRTDPQTNTFTPKNPSPARLRRVWETCQRFWKGTVQPILDALPGRVRWLLEVEEKDHLPPQDVVCDGTLNGQPISVWRLNNALLTVSFVPKEPKAGRLHLTWEDQGQKRQATYQVKDVKKPSADYLCYRPTLTLLASPDQFLALVPAADALEIADEIRKAYETEFGKVQNRLPLFLGLVFFPRKTPLLAVMDTARRMLDVPLGEESWTVECCRPDGERYEHQYLRLSQGNFRLVIKFPIKMGDKKTCDIWYPYMFVEYFADGTTDNRQYRFQHNGRWLVHVCDLKEDDVVKITPSRFTYLFLENTVQRFHFDLQRDVMLLNELPRLREMWDRLKQSGITITGLRNLQALLEAKGEAWGINSEEFRHLAETALKNAGLFQRRDKDGNPLPDVITPEDVVSKRFGHCLELYLHILKDKVTQ